MNKYPSIQFVYLVLSFVIVMILFFYGTAQIITFFKVGANKSDNLLVSSEKVNDFYQPLVSSYQMGQNEGRKMERDTYEKISRDYVAASYYQFKALQTGNIDGLKDYFTKTVREHLIDLTEEYRLQNLSFEGTTIEHHNKINFYSEDGTQVTLEDEVISFQQLEKEGFPTVKTYDTSTYEVMLLLEDNFWRIRHKVKDGTALTLPPTPQLIKEKSIYTAEKQIYVDSIPFQIKGMNFYPQNAPWQKMWGDFDTAIIANDFKLIQSIGFNTLRVFVPYDYFGKASVKENELAKLIKVMDIAESHHLKVIVTLFDFFLGYTIEEWTLSDRHAETIVSALFDHPALLAWDIKNEPDLDYERIGKEKVDEWLNFIIRRIRRYDPGALITIGWSQPEFMENLQDELDFLSFHFYRDPSELVSFMTGRTFNKPIFLGETGMHTYESWWYPFDQSQKDQAKYYENIINISTQHDIHYAIWTLYDFTEVPANVAGKWPWQRNPQKSYGLITTSNEHKLSYELLKTLNNNK